MDWEEKVKTIADQAIKIGALAGYIYVLKLNNANPESVIDPFAHGALLILSSGVDMVELTKVVLAAIKAWRKSL